MFPIGNGYMQGKDYAINNLILMANGKLKFWRKLKYYYKLKEINIRQVLKTRKELSESNKS